jgi:hypothetical protein
MGTQFDSKWPPTGISNTELTSQTRSYQLNLGAISSNAEISTQTRSYQLKRGAISSNAELLSQTRVYSTEILSYQATVTVITSKVSCATA